MSSLIEPTLNIKELHGYYAFALCRPTIVSGYTSVYSHLNTNIQQFKEMGAIRMTPSTTRLSLELRGIVNCCYSSDGFVKSTTWSC